MHGDVYGHNILWDGRGGAAMLGDFGAASNLPAGTAGRALARTETRAFGILLAEMLDRCGEAPARLRGLADACAGPDAGTRPDMAEVAGTLAAMSLAR